ncbi:hypothetical protein G7K_4008-t1 [Saitoella complicata NRRL Y-17804]|uniref:5'-3' DNA helicase ZGRF1-like N-terminal domain-containing protein n=1 Tax=Saitoella complicata (strain BCRC 22490 / CBS 7301 / JCM 7358 / NBRC 10748 / NRRL Y-17804) TaxID=698492 RepID=A0A0E9NJL8_SAICN|nr:hypothetical protein G7K_4008-t1 [Saitoella complicata NRRL Y-17804]
MGNCQGFKGDIRGSFGVQVFGVISHSMHSYSSYFQKNTPGEVHVLQSKLKERGVRIIIMALSDTPRPPMLANVHEFAVMYTPDKHKKQKVWHDGILRFHAFNFRAMLYDETRTLTDSIFLPNHPVPSVGDEVRFDRHTVTVERVIEITQTDITPILVRKRSGAPLDDVSQEKTARTGVKRFGAAPRAVMSKGPSYGATHMETPVRQTLRPNRTMSIIRRSALPTPVSGPSFRLPSLQPPSVRGPLQPAVSPRQPAAFRTAYNQTETPTRPLRAPTTKPINALPAQMSLQRPQVQQRGPAVTQPATPQPYQQQRRYATPGAVSRTGSLEQNNLGNGLVGHAHGSMATPSATPDLSLPDEFFDDYREDTEEQRPNLHSVPKTGALPREAPMPCRGRPAPTNRHQQRKDPIQDRRAKSAGTSLPVSDGPSFPEPAPFEDALSIQQRMRSKLDAIAAGGRPQNNPSRNTFHRPQLNLDTQNEGQTIPDTQVVIKEEPKDDHIYARTVPPLPKPLSPIATSPPRKDASVIPRAQTSPKELDFSNAEDITGLSAQAGTQDIMEVGRLPKQVKPSDLPRPDDDEISEPESDDFDMASLFAAGPSKKSTLTIGGMIKSKPKAARSPPARQPSRFKRAPGFQSALAMPLGTLTHFLPLESAEEESVARILSYADDTTQWPRDKNQKNRRILLKMRMWMRTQDRLSSSHRDMKDKPSNTLSDLQWAALYFHIRISYFPYSSMMVTAAGWTAASACMKQTGWTELQEIYTDTYKHTHAHITRHHNQCCLASDLCRWAVSHLLVSLAEASRSAMDPAVSSPSMSHQETSLASRASNQERSARRRTGKTSGFTAMVVVLSLEEFCTTTGLTLLFRHGLWRRLRREWWRRASSLTTLTLLSSTKRSAWHGSLLSEIRDGADVKEGLPKKWSPFDVYDTLIETAVFGVYLVDSYAIVNRADWHDNIESIYHYYIIPTSEVN